MHGGRGCAWQGACVARGKGIVRGGGLRGGGGEGGEETATAAGGTHPAGMYSCYLHSITLVKTMHAIKELLWHCELSKNVISQEYKVVGFQQYNLI